MAASLALHTALLGAPVVDHAAHSVRARPTTNLERFAKPETMRILRQEHTPESINQRAVYVPV